MLRTRPKIVTHRSRVYGLVVGRSPDLLWAGLPTCCGPVSVLLWAGLQTGPPHVRQWVVRRPRHNGQETTPQPRSPTDIAWMLQ